MLKGKAFDSIGTSLPNIRWGWSGIASDKSKVAILIWVDEFSDDSPPGSDFDIRDYQPFLACRHRAGNRSRKTHISHAIEHLEGKVEIIWAESHDPSAKTRGVKRAWHRSDMFGVIDEDEFDRETGGFRVVLHARDV